MQSDDEDLPDFDRIGTKWPAFLIEEFKLMRPVAVWLAGSRDLVSVTLHHPNGTRTQFGTGNRPCRAVKLGLSRHWNDEVSWRVNQSPYFEQRMLARVWVKNDDDGKLLMLQAVRMLADQGEPTELLKDWIDVGPDVPLQSLALKLVEAAQDSIVECWSDQALVSHLLQNARTRRAFEARAKGVAQRGGKLRVVSGAR